MLRLMGDMFKLIWWAVIGLFRSRASLEAEILMLRHLQSIGHADMARSRHRGVSLTCQEIFA